MKGAEKRFRLWKMQRGVCHWCGCDTFMRWRGGGSPKPDEATIDHIDDRLSPERGQHPGERRQVMACNTCNHRRHKEGQLAAGIEVLRERSQRHGVGK